MTFFFFILSVPTFTVIPDSLRVVSPLNVDSDDDEDDEDSDDDVPSEGVPIEQYRAWLGEWLMWLKYCHIGLLSYI